MPLCSKLGNYKLSIKFTGTCGANMVQGYSFVGDNTPETLIVYCVI